MATKTDAKIVSDPTHGYFRLDPIPSEETIAKYYKKQYFKGIKRGGRAQEIQRQIAGGEEAKAELDWLNRTLYKDIVHTLNLHVIRRARRLLDVGCGTGAFLQYARSIDWDVFGLEPSEDDIVQSIDEIPICHVTLDEFAKSRFEKYDAITLLSVLEHIPNPLGALEMAKSLLNDGGVICIRVPNDFSPLQLCADAKLNTGQWWVTSPDHINYFNFASLERLMEVAGLEVIYRTTDFPMELFLLMGDDYIGNPAVGSECHKKRKSFEMSIPDVTRRGIYHSLADIGIGRSCIVFARVGQEAQ